ncbi:MAG: porin family protein [Bacteroidales bacterium]|nr:porin family protein [Bacteroidales bacterium]
MKKIFITLVSMLITLHSFGQESFWSLTYQMSVPTGDTKNITDKMSFRGIGLEGRWFVDNNVTIGGAALWNVFYEKQDKITTELENITLTGTHYNYINALPFFVNTAYYFNEGSYVRPYAAMNAGVIYTLYRKDIGLYRIDEEAWKFGVAPEIGVLIETYGGANFTVNFRYNYGLETDNSDPLSYIGINVGVVWLY